MAEPPTNPWGEPPLPAHPPPSSWAPPPPHITHVAPAPPRAGLGEILDGAFHAVRGRLRAVLPVTFVAVALLTLLNVLALLPVGAWISGLNGFRELTSPTVLPGEPGAPTVTSTPADAAALVAVIAEGATRVLVLTGALLVTGLIAPALVPRAARPAAIADQAHDPDDDTHDARRLWRRVRPRLGPLVLTTLAVAGAVVAPAVVLALPGVVVMTLGGIATLIGGGLVAMGAFVGFVIGLLLWGVRLCLAPQAVVLEGLGARQSLRRSVDLVRGQYGRMLGVLLVVGLLSWVLAGLVSAPFATVGALVAGSGTGDGLASLGLTPVQLAISGVGAIISSTLAIPLFAAVLTLLFTDLRRERDLTRHPAVR
ncbi:MAG TPA: hypothetical protein VFX33_01765 [Actinomycetales bacterium]|nr:hypothetical protein [Actinomycetales bacterium]